MALDPVAFDALYGAHADAVYRSALGIVRDPDAASDVVQETFIRAFSATDEIAAPGAWLATVARRLAIDEVRKRHRLTGLAEDAAEDEQAGRTVLVSDAVWADPAKSAASADSISVARACLDALRPDDRTLLTLRYVDDEEIGEIADLLGRTVNATTVALHRARARFDAAYAERVFGRPSVPDTCRAFRDDAVAHADGRSASAAYQAHLETCAICAESDADLRSRSKAFVLAPLLGLPLSAPASLKSTIAESLAARGIPLGPEAEGPAASGGNGSVTSGSTPSVPGGTVGGSTAAAGVGSKVAVLVLAAVAAVAGIAAIVGGAFGSPPGSTGQQVATEIPGSYESAPATPADSALTPASAEPTPAPASVDPDVRIVESKVVPVDEMNIATDPADRSYALVSIEIANADPTRYAVVSVDPGLSFRGSPPPDPIAEVPTRFLVPPGDSSLMFQLYTVPAADLTMAPRITSITWHDGPAWGDTGLIPDPRPRNGNWVLTSQGAVEVRWSVWVALVVDGRPELDAPSHLLDCEVVPPGSTGVEVPQTALQREIASLPGGHHVTWIYDWVPCADQPWLEAADG